MLYRDAVNDLFDLYLDETVDAASGDVPTGAAYLSRPSTASVPTTYAFSYPLLLPLIYKLQTVRN